MLFDQALDAAVRKPAARVLQPVRRDGEQHLVGLVARGLHALHQVDALDRVAHRVQQRRAAVAAVFLAREGRHLADVDAVVNDARLVVEQDGRHRGFAWLLAVLLQQRVEPADGVGGQMVHRPARIQDEDDLDARAFLGRKGRPVVGGMGHVVLLDGCAGVRDLRGDVLLGARRGVRLGARLGVLHGDLLRRCFPLHLRGYAARRPGR